MQGPLFRFLADDHARLSRLLQQAEADPGKIDYRAYAEFRAGLLKHIAMEEKILLPAARRLRAYEVLGHRNRHPGRERVKPGGLGALPFRSKSLKFRKHGVDSSVVARPLTHSEPLPC